MHSLKRSAVLAVLLLVFATPCLAESTMKTVFEDVFYGGLSGGLVGAAVLAFTKHPGNHLDFMGYGAATGMLVGATYGVVTTTRSLAELDHGGVKFSIPTILPEFREEGRQTAIIATAQLFRGKF